MLTITDGSSTKSQNLKSVCSSVSSSTVRSTGKYMTIKFKTNSDDYFVTNNAGFKLKYYETEIKHYEPKPESASNVGMIVGIVFGVIFGLGLLLVCCVWVRKRQSNAGNVQRVPAAATTHLTTMTASHAPIAPGAPQYPMQTQGGPPAQGSFVVPAGSYPPPGQSSYPSDKGSYPPPHGTFALPGHSHPLPIQGTYSPPGGYSPYPQVSYIPPVNGPVSGDPPPQYPGINADSSQAPPAFNPSFMDHLKPVHHI
ncbi:hypothetical protein AC249_AIPGENE19468 [Exaiptasia diaphana]|nr:hypothetical protein AC249_AIPGENE19468 [Exaiptasia diaphana]